MNGPSNSDPKQLAARSRRAFLTVAVAGAAGTAGWTWLRSRPEEEGLAGPFRRVLRMNEGVGKAYFGPNHLAPVYPGDAAQRARTNGDIGLDGEAAAGSWRLAVHPLAGSDKPHRVTLADIQALPRVEHVTALKCIEGWSVVSQWAGARFSDFTDKYAPESRQAPYVSLKTPDEEYFVGLDIASALHPQTLLCYELNHAPLTPEHGAPLRLIVPVKYGIKNIKRIGSVAYTAKRPEDYWANEGYDWYAGL